MIRTFFHVYAMLYIYLVITFCCVCVCVWRTRRFLASPKRESHL